MPALSDGGSHKPYCRRLGVYFLRQDIFILIEMLEVYYRRKDSSYPHLMRIRSASRITKDGKRCRD